jgi:hypothetical protein
MGGEICPEHTKWGDSNVAQSMLQGIGQNNFDMVRARTM